MRQWAVSKLIAIALVALVVCPLTAPFSTCDLTAVVSAFHEELISARGVAQEPPALGTSLTSTSPTLHQILAPAGVSGAPLEHQQPLVLVLRL
jgi:hypothetical protein